MSQSEVARLLDLRLVWPYLVFVSLLVCLFFFSTNGMCIISACLGTQIFRDFYWTHTTIKAKQCSIYFRWKIEFHGNMAGWVGRIDMWLTPLAFNVLWRLWIKDCIFIAMIYQIYFLILKMILFLYLDFLTCASTTLLFYPGHHPVTVLLCA